MTVQYINKWYFSSVFWRCNSTHIFPQITSYNQTVTNCLGQRSWPTVAQRHLIMFKLYSVTHSGFWFIDQHILHCLSLTPVLHLFTHTHFYLEKKKKIQRVEIVPTDDPSTIHFLWLIQNQIRFCVVTVRIQGDEKQFIAFLTFAI